MRPRILLLLLGILSASLPAPAHAASTWKINSKNFSSDTGGYLVPNSVLPGDEVRAFITCPKKSFVLTAYRMGYYEGSEAQEYWNSGPLPCILQPAPEVDSRTHMSETSWSESVVIPTAELPPGFYLLKITTDIGHQAFMPLAIRQFDARGRTVIAIPTLTSLAYNTWKGASAYRGAKDFSDRARVLSFDRPNKIGLGSGKYLNYVHPLVVTAERLGLSIDYVTDVDVATIPGLLDGATAYVSGGHDEYWTDSERTAVISAREQGTNTVYFGANVAYWRVRLASSPLGENRRMEIYKSSKEDPDKSTPTIRFRDVKKSENVLTGQLYNCFPATGTFTVTDPNSFIFAGSGARNGSQYAGILGPEVDRYVADAAFPGKVKVIAKSSVTCGKDISTSTTMIYGVATTGAGIISVGTMKWVTRGLTSVVSERTRDFVTKVTENIFLRSSEGPLGDTFALVK